MLITILTLFPEMFKGVFDFSIVKRAAKTQKIKINLVNIRDFASSKHKTVDDKPYGGGVGMLMKVDVVEKAIESVKRIKRKGPPNRRIKERGDKELVVLLDPKGKTFNQKRAEKLSKLDHLILICGHYEGIDSRILNFIDESISIGNYILTGGELAAMVVTDAVVRLVPNVLTKKEAALEESFSKKYVFEPPQYTKPRIYKGLKVPEVLLSGNHKKINKWKEKQSKKR